ncbi:MAG TPA: hypothetical protein PKI37_06300 [Candidatus Cloacimonas sp.]|nr:hypothetical protein [Candidatus Cloacimonas sp.]
MKDTVKEEIKGFSGKLSFGGTASAGTQLGGTASAGTQLRRNGVRRYTTSAERRPPVHNSAERRPPVPRAASAGYTSYLRAIKSHKIPSILFIPDLLNPVKSLQSCSSQTY